MSIESIEADIYMSFENFYGKIPPEEFGGDSYSLMAYIVKWVESGEGIRACAGNFQVYLLAVIAIIEHWVTDPGILNYLTDDEDNPKEIERRATSIYGDDPAVRRWALDEHWFAGQVFKHLHPAP